MPLQHYVSAEWVETLGPGGTTKTIKALGDDDSVWWIPSLRCDVPPFPAFLESEAGKAFLAATPEELRATDDASESSQNE